MKRIETIRCLSSLRSIAICLALGGLSLAGAAYSTTLVEANVKDVTVGESIPVATIPDGIYLRKTNDPDDTVWERLPEYKISLTSAPAVHPSVALRVDPETKPVDVHFMVGKTSERLYVRMRWRDATPDIVTRKDKFRDGAAAQFSLGDSSTSFMMGTNADSPVNIWYWRADNGTVENLAAGGFSSTTSLKEQTVSAGSQFIDRDGDASEWVVVMSRPLRAAGDLQVDFTEADTVPMALAVWQGADAQRDGLKSVTLGWLNLTLGQ